jgi:heme-degrading monooxygenase HmoA
MVEQRHLNAVTINLEKYPSGRYRIDAFSVPEPAREEFEAAMRRNLAFLETLPGFAGHVVFEKDGGPSTFNIVTLAVWESEEALENAGTQVRAYYQSIGFDPPAQLARWGVEAEIGNYSAPPDLQ